MDENFISFIKKYFSVTNAGAGIYIVNTPEGKYKIKKLDESVRESKSEEIPNFLKKIGEDDLYPNASISRSDPKGSLFSKKDSKAQNPYRFDPIFPSSSTKFYQPDPDNSDPGSDLELI